MPRPLALTDEQLNIIVRASEPLHYPDRGPYLERVAELLRGCEVIGDGLVSRIARQAQAEFWRAPELDRARVPSKWSRG
jgi:hypothetical protein